MRAASAMVYMRRDLQARNRFEQGEKFKVFMHSALFTYNAE